jgi:asparagine synthase (glutamine-hydrolysing)
MAIRRARRIGKVRSMCGFCGMVYFDPARPAQESVLRAMNAQIRHRGPDGDGYYAASGAGLAFQRLAIIDLQRGWQPLYNEDRSVVICFNGEIYNHHEIRTQLAPHHTFSSGADTEVILHGWEEWGEAIVPKLRGMFAFAIWDANRKVLFVARDRLGIKPFYYYTSPHGLVFGSEIKAILEHPDVRRDLDYEALDSYLSLLYIPAPQTIWKNLRKLPAAHTLRVEAGRVTIKPYWDLRFPEPVGRLSEADWRQEVLDALDESVGCHLESDVPLGAFLSGGVDSSAVVSSMAANDARARQDMRHRLLGGALERAAASARRQRALRDPARGVHGRRPGARRPRPALLALRRAVRGFLGAAHVPCVAVGAPGGDGRGVGRWRRRELRRLPALLL